MLKNKTVRFILSILATIALIAIIALEVKVAFGLLHDRTMAGVKASVTVTATKAKASVSISEIVSYPEIADVAIDGDVIAVKDYDIKLRINGKLTDDSMSTYGKYVYSSAKSHSEKTLEVTDKTSNVDKFHEALAAFWKGDTSLLFTSDATGLVFDTNDVTWSQCSSSKGNVPIAYVESSKTYYMFVDCDKTEKDKAHFIYITSEEPFTLTDDKVTVHYGDPKANPQTTHSYDAIYETWAASATVKEKMNDTETVDSYNATTDKYASTSSSGTASTYTSTSDDDIRKKMVSLSDYTFTADGKSDETSLIVDISSDNAKASQWTLTSSSYSYSYAGLKVYALQGNRTSDSFYVEGTISNTLDAVRPYVIVVKYLDSNNKLLGVKVIDNRESPLSSKDAATFNISISPTRDKIDIQKITSVMFEVY